MRSSRIRHNLNNNLPSLVTTLHFLDEALFEMTSLMGFDGIWLDLEHHSGSDETAARMMRAVRCGTSDVVVRPAKGEFLRMGRLLEAGADAIMYPQCDNAAEAEQLVQWIKFPPMGRRGFDGANADVPYFSQPISEYIAEANQRNVVIVQIETAAGLDAVESIAKVPGVDILMMGPADLSLQLGVPGQFEHALLRDAQHRIALAAQENHIAWGRPAGSVNQVQQLLDQGAKWICFGADIVFVKSALEKMQADLKPFGFEFKNQLG
ncbi:MAG: aldolase [Planctomycetales bacterium]|nr:aldolase [Planctomycetales bacterium]